jgi:hypothetical protein
MSCRHADVASLVGIAPCTITTQGDQVCGGTQTMPVQSFVSAQRSLQEQKVASQWGASGWGSCGPPAAPPWAADAANCRYQVSDFGRA